jgi:amino acid adenylation domain-containing protein/non-ribosomal peptide synthase protein (TIGR01720 family)
MLSKENIQNIYPLSPMQEGMFFHALYEPNSSVYFEQTSYRLHGSLNIKLVEKSLNELFKRYDILRTIFSKKKSEKLLQIVLKERMVDFFYEDISGREDKEEYVVNFRERDKKNVFDLTRDVLMRVAVLQTSAEEYEFIWSHHHILMDGWCMGILISEFFEIYTSLLEKRPFKLPPVIPYSRYIQWLEKQSKMQSQNYWTHYVAFYNEVASLPQKRTHRADEGYKGDQVVVTLDKETTVQLNRLTVDCQVTMNTLIQSLWGLLLARYTGRQDMIFGAVVSGRPSKIHGIDTMVGLFINTIPVRIRFKPRTRFDQLLQTVQKNALESEPFHYYPLAKIQSHSSLKQNLFDHIIAFQNFPLAQQIKGGTHQSGKTSSLRLRVSNVESFEQINYDFGILVSVDKQLSIRLDFNAHVYDRQLINGIGDHLQYLIRQVLAKENFYIEELSILSEEEKKKILVDFNDTKREYPDTKTLYQLFEEQAARTGDKIAVISTAPGAERAALHALRCALTYNELNEKSNQLAHLLRAKGVEPDTFVALVVTPSAEMAVGILGILKAGGAYLPIDPEYPQDRINYMLKDSNAKILVTTQTPQNLSEGIVLEKEIIYLEDYKDKKDIHHSSDQFIIHHSDSLAYVIYTSGTTGRPKGMGVEHRNVVNTLLCRKENYKMKESDVALQLFSYSFDGFVTSFFTPIISSASVVLVSEENIKDTAKLGEIIVNQQVTHFICIPPLFRSILEHLTPEKAASLKVVTLAGDNIPFKLLEITSNKNPEIEIVNEYGVTESSVMSTLNRHQEMDPIVNIGKPAWNTAIYILDQQDRLQPVGIPGELCISGRGVGRGYLNNPELTAVNFDQDFSDYQDDQNEKEKSEGSHHSALYRTGDLARWMPNGAIELVGRTDFQVKIRGYRIELGEIENQLLKYEEIRETVVTAIKDKSGDLSLCAYIVPHHFGSMHMIDRAELRGFLSRQLPGYMVPTYFVLLKSLPLTPNGKIDRKILPQPEMPGDEEYVAPRTETEIRLVKVWSDVLHLEEENIGIDANFFDLGGHSLNAISLSSKIHKELNAKVELTDIFKTPTIRELAELIKGVKEERFFSIKPTEEKEYYRASSTQKRLYLLQQMETENIFYNMQQILELGEKVDREKLEKTMRQLIKRHESLRTSFHMMNEKLLQKIHNEVEFKIEYYNSWLSHNEQVGGSEDNVQHLIGNFIRPFNLSQAPLFRVGIIKRKNFNDLMMVDIHHIISDGVSQGVLEEDFTILYHGEQLPPLRLQYKDYSEWQNSKHEKEAFQQQKEFWQEEFEGEIPVLDLPIDFPRPAIQSFEGSSEYFTLNRDTTSALKRVALENGATLYMVLLAVTNILFSKLSQQEAIVIGTPTAGRRHTDLDHTIGAFINTLAMKNHPKGETAFITFLHELKTRTLKAFENQDYPFEDLIETVVINRDASRNPLFDVMFTLAKFDPMTGQGIVGKGRKYAALLQYKVEHHTSKFDITINGMEYAEELSFALEYCTKLFKKETIHRFIDYFKKIVSSLLENPEQRISQIEIISEEEKQRILLDYNNTKAEYPADKTIEQLFEEQAAKTPDNIALVYNGQSMTYKELNQKADDLVSFLRIKGVTTDTAVGIMAERSMEVIVAVLAILKAGGAYLPIDPNYPQHRIDFMLADSNARILMSDVSKVSGVSEVIDLNQLTDPTTQPLPNSLNYPLNDSTTQPGSSNLAYIMYTSGSTGRPKGVIVEHQNVVRLVKNTNFVQLRSDDRILQTGALEFDASTFEIWGALLNGLPLYLADKDKIVTPNALKQIITENKITTMWMTAPLFNQLVQEDVEIFGKLRNLLVGGDVLSPSHINRLRMRFPHVNIINGYGPTENTTFSTTFLIDREYTERIPIGKPIANSTAYIFDRYDNVQAPGINGELCAGGDGVARGYMNNPELTHEKFTTNPYVPGERLYRTGDLARWLSDNSDGDSSIIEFSGRFDNQIKIRGFRVEPGEIEIQLLKHDEIKEAVVMVMKESTDTDTDRVTVTNEAGEPGKRLCAYIVFEHALEKTLDIAKLREYLSHRLPDYMIPAYFVKLEEMPLTPNGKIDRDALANMEIANMETGAAYATPRNEIEEKLVEIWKSVLGRPQVGIREDFFMIGGDSIKAIQISSRMNTAGYQVEMRDIFQYSTIIELAPCIKKIQKVTDQSLITGVTPLTPIQQKYFQVPRKDPHHFNQSVMFNFKDGIEEEVVRALFLKIQEHHDALRMTYKKDFNGTVIQENQGLDLPLSLQVFDLRQEENPGEVLEARANEIQASINLKTGPLMKLGLFCLGDGHRLLVVIHHLVVDGVSWRILFEDIKTLYNQYKEHGEGAIFKLPLKTTSFNTWSEKLCQYANSDSFLKEEKKYWEKMESINIPPIPKDFEEEAHNYIKDTTTLSFALSPQETELLLSKVNEAFGTEINDILLTAFGLGIKKTFGKDQVLIALEGHGREEILEDANIKRTVGWFTSVYPVVLDLSYVSSDNENNDLSRQIKEVKEMLRQIPHKGMGYGVLKYLTAKEKKVDINFQLNPPISFNYLGQFDNEVKKMPFEFALEFHGNDQSVNDEREHDLEVSGSITNNQLWMSIRYNTKHFKAETIETLLSRYKEELTHIISYCSTRQEKELTPSDFTYDKLSIDSIEALDALISRKK